MKLTKKNLINYLVDCLGHDEEEAKEISNVYGSTYLTENQRNECIEFSK